MRKDSFLMLSVLVLTLGIGGCSKDDGNVVGDSREISFGITSVTRAVIDGENFADGSSFCVWGWRQLGTDGIPVNVFDKTPVTYSGGKWEYEGKRYWVPDYTYGFYAVYPEFPAAGAEGQTTAASVADDGTITVTGFDCSKTGTEAVDLMTASKTGIHYTEEQPVQPVPLVFSHELSRLKFTVKSENAVDTIKSFKVYGVNYQGTLTKKGENATWNPVVATTAENTPFRLATSFTFNTTNGWEKDMLGDVLLIPDTDLKDAKLEIVHRYKGDTADRTSVVDLHTVKTSQWEAGKSYHYSLTIKGGTLSITVKVKDWTEEDTSVSWG